METTSAASPAPPEAAASQQVFQIALGYIASTALYVAVKLGVADHLAAGSLSIDDLARAAGSRANGAVNPDALYRVLRMLASVGVFEESSPRHFANNAASNTIRTGIPGSQRDMGLWIADPFHLRVYADALHSVTTPAGGGENRRHAGVRVLPDQPGAVGGFLTGFSASVIAAALEVYDFSGIGTLVDVAGGHGQVLASILQRYPAMQGVLFDLDHVRAGAVPRLRELGLDGRITTATGDFFKAVPPGGDAYIMKHIIHDWDDDRAITILRNIRSAMNRGGRVILLESVLLPGNAPDFGKLIDLEMLMMTGGRERTEAEFRSLFQRAGFELTRIVPTQSPLSVIEAR